MRRDPAGIKRLRFALAMVATIVLIVPGCMKDQLRYSIRRATSTLPDLQYQQVIDNLAMIADNPGYLPYLAVAGQGSVQVTDGGSSSLSVPFGNSTFNTTTLGLGATRNITGTWSVGTITDPDKIRQMRALYRAAVLGTSQGVPGAGWLQIGCRRDVPKSAVYVGRQGRVYAWVTPEGLDGLSELTLQIMDIATRADSAEPSPHAIFRGSGPDALPVPRRNFQSPPIGPVFTPGVR